MPGAKRKNRRPKRPPQPKPPLQNQRQRQPPQNRPRKLLRQQRHRLPKPPPNQRLRQHPRMNGLDQVFVRLCHWFAGLFPASVQPLIACIVAITAIMVVFASCFALTTIVERKVLGRMQESLWPNRVALGSASAARRWPQDADQEDIVPYSADKTVHFLAAAGLDGADLASRLRCCRLAAT